MTLRVYQLEEAATHDEARAIGGYVCLDMAGDIEWRVARRKRALDGVGIGRNSGTIEWIQRRHEFPTILVLPTFRLPAAGDTLGSTFPASASQ